MEAGLYVTFFDKDEPASRELPAVGPLYNVVVRHKSLVAERRTVMQAQELGVAIDRWLEAELEMQRATGDEPGGNKRADKRLAARDGVYLRFAVFGEAHEPDIAPELGPFAAVVVGQRTVEADGRTLATRAASDLAPWELVSGAGEDLDGKHKPDIAFRTANTSYHPSITASVPVSPAPVVVSTAPTAAAGPELMPSEPAFAIPPRSEPVFAPAPNAQAFFTPPPRTEQVIRPADPTQSVIRPTPRTEQVIRIGPRPESAPAPSENVSPFQERPRRPTEIYSAREGASRPAVEEKLTPGDVELIARIDRERSDESLRARIHEGERRRLGINDQGTDAATSASMRYRAQPATEPEYASDAGFEWGPALWRMRFAIIGVLVLLVAGYVFVVLRSGTALTFGPGQQLQYVGIAQRFSGTGWDFVVNGVQRTPTAGAATARGSYYAVRIGATNKGADGRQLSPGDFTLVDANGTEYRAEGLSSGVYQGSGNPTSAFIWPDSFPSGRSVTFSVVFDVDPTLPRGTLLKLTDPATIRVRLD